MVLLKQTPAAVKAAHELTATEPTSSGSSFSHHPATVVLLDLNSTAVAGGVGGDNDAVLLMHVLGAYALL